LKGKIEKKNKINKKSKTKNKNQENEDQIWKKIKNQDYWFKDETENKLKFDKRVKNQNIKGLTLNIIKLWIEKRNQIHKRIQIKDKNQENEDRTRRN
jgi:hypothetical protein